MQKTNKLLIIGMIICLGFSAFAIAKAAFYDPATYYQLGNSTAYSSYTRLYMGENHIHWVDPSNHDGLDPNIYINGENTSSPSNTAILLDRKLGYGSEITFADKNGSEIGSLMERYNGTLAWRLIQVPSNIYPYSMEWVPAGTKGEIIMFWKPYMISQQGYFGELQTFDNGTVKFKKGDPTWSPCSSNC